jgi:endonuclease/exonuclease/phosphatase family metal-dependent hydrolase
MANVVCTRNTVRVVHQLVVTLIAMCGFTVAASAQTTTTLSTPGTHLTADLMIQGGASGMTDFSDSPVLASKVSSPDFTRRIFLKFNTQDFIPANATIQSARVQLVMTAAQTSENRPFTAYHVQQSFVTDETNWYYFRPGQRWNTPGGDLGASFGTTTVGNSVGSTYSFDVTQLVQKAVKGEFGSRWTRLALVDTGGSSSGSYKEFHSTRSTNTGARPRLVITYTTSGSAQAAPPPPAPGSGTALKVMTWNVHKTKGSDGACNPDRIANTIVSLGAHVVSLNEVNYFSGVCAWNFDMGERLRTLVEQKTGVRWYRQSNHPAVNAVDVLLSRYPFVTSSETLISYNRGIAQIGIVVNGRNVNLFATHIEWENRSWVPIQIAEVVRWMNSFPEPRIVMGDFNTWPGTSDYKIIANVTHDAWVVGQSAGTATAFNGTGLTHGGSRFDYVFYSKVAALSLKSVHVPDTRVNGVWPSDHHPVVAVFNVN